MLSSPSTRLRTRTPRLNRARTQTRTETPPLPPCPTPTPPLTRIMTAENILDLNHGANAKNFADLQGAPAKRVGGPTIRAGVNPKEVQYAQQCLKEQVPPTWTYRAHSLHSTD